MSIQKVIVYSAIIAALIMFLIGASKELSKIEDHCFTAQDLCKTKNYETATCLPNVYTEIDDKLYIHCTDRTIINGTLTTQEKYYWVTE